MLLSLLFFFFSLLHLFCFLAEWRVPHLYPVLHELSKVRLVNCGNTLSYLHVAWGRSMQFMWSVGTMCLALCRILWEDCRNAENDHRGILILIHSGQGLPSRASMGGENCEWPWRRPKRLLGVLHWTPRSVWLEEGLSVNPLVCVLCF